MRAMVIPGFGGEELFEERDIPTPEPGPGQVRVRVHAASVNPVDTKLRENGRWAGVEPPAVLGSDVAGTVDAVGAGVDSLAAGDAVFYSARLGPGDGAYAEYNVSDASIVAPMPAGLAFEEAASLPLAGMTAWDGLVQRAGVRVAETVLVHGGGGGVGTLAIQLARAAGARVLTTCGRYDFDLVEDLGAEFAIDYREEDFVEEVRAATGGSGVDVVFDTVGGDTIARSVEITRRHGRHATVIGSSGDLSMAYRRNITLHMVMMEREGRKLDALRTLVEEGSLRPVVDSVRPLREVAQAHRDLAEGGVRGKIVLSVYGGE